MSNDYCFLRVSVRKPDGSVQDYVVDGAVTVRDFAIKVLGAESGGGSIQILEIVTIPGGITPIPFGTHTIWRDDK